MDRYRDQHGKFATGGLLDARFSPLDRTLVDYEPRRPLTDPLKDEVISRLIPGAKFVPYAETPFFTHLQQLQGTVDLVHLTGEQNEVARDALFHQQSIEDIPIAEMAFTQNVVNRDAIAHLLSGTDDFDGKPAYIVRYDSKHWTIDGHHRTVAAFIKGKPTIRSYVLSL